MITRTLQWKPIFQIFANFEAQCAIKVSKYFGE